MATNENHHQPMQLQPRRFSGQKRPMNNERNEMLMPKTSLYKRGYMHGSRNEVIFESKTEKKHTILCFWLNRD